MTEREIQRFITYKLVEAREKNLITQRQLSKLSGVTQSKLSRIENGRRNIRVFELYILSKILKKSITFFFPKTK